MKALKMEMERDARRGAEDKAAKQAIYDGLQSLREEFPIAKSVSHQFLWWAAHTVGLKKMRELAAVHLSGYYWKKAITREVDRNQPQVKK